MSRAISRAVRPAYKTKVEYCKQGKKFKVKYDKRGAVTAKNARMHQDHVRLRIYPCPNCGGWHLTHKILWDGLKQK